MVEKITGYLILDALSGGSADNGQRVTFDLRLMAEPEPETTTFLCDYHVFNSVIIKLAAYATIASEDRLKHSPAPGGTHYIDRSMPFEATVFEAGRGIPSGNIALRIRTKQNIPIDISMSPEDARALAKQLLREIGSPSLPSPLKPS